MTQPIDDIFQAFQEEATEWHAEREWHAWHARQNAYHAVLDSPTLGAAWLDKNQVEFKQELDKIEFGIVAANDGTLKEWVIREFAALDKMHSHPAWDESIHTGTWRGMCKKCGKRQRYYHEPTKRLFPLCAVCGVNAINELLGEKIL